MARSISTAGLTPFQVTIDNTVPGMVRFVRAVARVDAKMVSTGNGTGTGPTLTFMVWLNPMRIAMFQAFCRPSGFQFVSSNAVQLDGTIAPEDR